jgi:predicted permease
VSGSRWPFLVRVYCAATRLLPRSARADGDEMAHALADLFAERTGRMTRATLCAWAFARLALVIGIEWLEELGVMPASRGLTKEPRSGGMALGRDLRYALRTLRKSPSFTITSVLLVALGVGAVTTIFTIVDHVLLRPLPYPDAERLVFVDQGSHSGPLFRDFHEMRTVDLWAASMDGEVNLVGQGDPVRLRQESVSEEFFNLFGARALHGRLLIASDFQAADVVVLDAGAWKRIWGADPGVVGRTLEIDGERVTVVGVVGDSFVPPDAVMRGAVDFWRPIQWSSEMMQNRDFNLFQVTGRLVPGATVAEAQKEMDALRARLAVGYADYLADDGSVTSLPVASLAEQTVRFVRSGLAVLLGAVGLLLLIACANVAHLFLARGLGRSREMAVRRAMGAASPTLFTQLLVESLVVGLAGGLLGTALAWAGIRTFVRLNPAALPRQSTFTIDLRVLGFAIGLSALTSLIFGMLPAWRSVRSQLATELRGSDRSVTGGRGLALVRGALVTLEVAMSLVLVAGAGLLMRSLLAVRSQDPGFEMADVWTIPLNVGVSDSPALAARKLDDILAALEATPGVRSAAYGMTMPLQYTDGGTCCWGGRVTGGALSPDGERVYNHPVTDGYFETLGIELVAGRKWRAEEVLDNPTPVVIGLSAARASYGGPTEALGKRLTLPGRGDVVVVGVATDQRYYGLDRDPGLNIYRPIATLPGPLAQPHFAVKADPAFAATIPSALREAVWSVEPRLPVDLVRSMDEWESKSTAGRRFDSLLFGVFAAAALLLAAGGLYGTLLYMAGQRRRELGIRLALGASRGAIERQVVSSGALLSVLGVAIGLAGAWQSAKYLESRMWGVAPHDVGTLAAAGALLIAVALLASWLPARRAGRVDPIETLRAD